MAFKSIIDIDVNDDKFKAFKESFDKLQSGMESFSKTASDIPDSMKGFEKHINNAQKAVSRLGHDKSMEKLKALMGGTAAEASKIPHALQRIPHAAKQGESAMKGMASAAGKVAHGLKSVVSFGLKLGGIGIAMAGISAGIGLFGLADLSRNAMNRAISARAAGMTPGQLAGFKVGYAGVFQNPGSVVQSVASASQSAEGKWALQSILGSSESQKNNFQKSMDVILSAKRIMSRYKNTGVALSIAKQRGFEALGLNQSDLLAIMNTPTADILRAQSVAIKAAPKLNFANKTAQAWAVLSVQLQEAGVQIQTSLINGLEKLAPAFHILSRNIADAIQNLLQSKGFKSVILDASAAVRKFADWIKSPAFNTALHHFATDLGKVGKFLSSPEFIGDLHKFGNAMMDVTQAILWVAKKLDWITKGKNAPLKETAAAAGAGALLFPGAASTAIGAGLRYSPFLAGVGSMLYSQSLNKGESAALQSAQRRAAVMAYMQSLGLHKAGAAAFAANFHVESGINPAAVGDNGRAYGIAQWHPGRQALFQKVMGRSIRGSTVEQQMQFSLWEFQHKYPDAWKAFKAAKTPAEKAAIMSQYYEAPADVQGNIRKRGALAQEYYNDPNVSVASRNLRQVLVSAFKEGFANAKINVTIHHEGPSPASRTAISAHAAAR